jgi:hypothetical protein
VVLHLYFTPKVHDGELDCATNTEGTGVDRASIVKNIEDFSQKNAGSNVSPNQGNSNNFYQKLGDSLATISVSYTPLVQEEAKRSTRSTNMPVTGFSAGTVDDCNTSYKRPYGKYGGQVTDDCGIFKLETKAIEQMECGQNPGPG